MLITCSRQQRVRKQEGERGRKRKKDEERRDRWKDALSYTINNTIFFFGKLTNIVRHLIEDSVSVYK